MPDWPQYHLWGKERPGQLRAAGTLGPERRPPDPRGQRPMDQIVVVPLTSLATSSNGDFVGLSLARTKSTPSGPAEAEEPQPQGFELRLVRRGPGAVGTGASSAT